MIDLNDADPQSPPFADASAYPQFDFVDIKDRLQKNLWWVEHFFPKGKESTCRKFWCMADWSGREPSGGGSCRINMGGDRPGWGYDFSTQEGADPIKVIGYATGLRGAELFMEAARIAGSSSVVRMPARGPAPKVEENAGHAASIIAGAGPLAGTHGEKYLASRGLRDPGTSDLLYHPDLTDIATRRGYCGLVAIARYGNGEKTGGIQRTYLTDDGSAKALGKDSRKSLGPIKGGSVRLAPIGADGHLGVAEGVETALSAMAIFGIPCWASLGTGMMASWEWPEEARRVTIFADAGDAGQKSSQILAKRLIEARIPFSIQSPLHGDDFNNDLARGAAAADYAPQAVVLPQPQAQANPVPLEACMSEDGMALEFARRNQNQLRYVNQWKSWMSWDGRVWHNERTLAAYDMIRSLCRDAALIAGADHGKKLRKAATVSAIETLSRSDRRLASTIEAWDADDWLLGTAGGIVDLRNGDNLGFQPDRYITRITTVAPDENQPVEAWLRFLRKVTRDNDEVISYLKRLCGYFLTGSTREHCLPFIFGPGRNGKGTFLNVLIGIMGELHKAADVSTFVEQKNPAHTTELARLHNARLVTCEETEKGQFWAEARLKKLTGGNVITARFMRCDDFEFLPKFKIVIVGNHKPKFRSVDEALRSRLHLIPFEVIIPKEERDHGLGDKLRKEYPGILAWMIQGAIEWQERGLDAPETILSATNEYLDGEDLTGQWLANRCVLEPFARTNLKELFDSWCNFCGLIGIKGVGLSKDLASELEKRLGEGSRKTAKGISRFMGIRLKTADECRQDMVVHDDE